MKKTANSYIKDIIMRIVFSCLSLLVLISYTNRAQLAQATQLSEKKKVLILNSYHVGYKWSDDIMQAIENHFSKSDMNVELYLEHIDSKRFPNRSFMPHLFSLLSAKYQATDFDLIITSDNNSIDFLLQYRARFFPTVPVIFCGFNNYDPKFIVDQSNITGVVEETDLKSTVDVALSLHPKTKTIVFIAATSRSSALNLKQLEEIQPDLEKRIEIEIWKDLTIEESEIRSRYLSTDTLLIIIGNSKNKKGDYVSIPEQFSRLTSASSVAIYSLWDFALGSGIVGGRLVNGTDQGKKAAELAIQILAGTSVSDIPVVTDTPTSYMFDYSQLKRFGINLKNLPEGSIVIKKPYSFYETKKKIVWTTLIVFAALIALIIALFLNVLRRQRAEKELQKHHDHLEDLVKERTVELSDTNKALLDSEKRYRSLSDAAFEGIVISEKGTILETNNTMAHMFGYQTTELVGMEATDLVVPDMREEVQNKILSGYEKPYESLGVTKNGTRFPIEVHAKMYSYKGRQVRVTATRDLTEQKKAEEEIKILRGILPICSFCKKIRDDKGCWEQVDVYIYKHSQADISHSICPECAKEHYPDLDIHK